MTTKKFKCDVVKVKETRRAEKEYRKGNLSHEGADDTAQRYLLYKKLSQVPNRSEHREAP